jgi:hypothetical protein
MLTTSKYIMHGNSSRCAFCNRAFRSREGYVEFWRASNGEHFCSEFCADDAEEARFCNQHAALAFRCLRPRIQRESRLRLVARSPPERVRSLD